MSYVLACILLAMGGIVGGAIGEAIYLSYSRRRSRRRDERFLGRLRIVYPEAKVIEIITIGPNQKQVIESIERRIRESSRDHH